MSSNLFSGHTPVKEEVFACIHVSDPVWKQTDMRNCRLAKVSCTPEEYNDPAVCDRCPIKQRHTTNETNKETSK
jgi:hypothetical protein